MNPANKTSTRAVQHGIGLLNQVMGAVDAQGNRDGKISSSDVEAFLDAFGDRGAMDAAVREAHRYAQGASGSKNPSVSAVGQALTQAHAQVGGESGAVASTLAAIAEFSKRYEGFRLDEIVTPVSPGPTKRLARTEGTTTNPGVAGGENGPVNDRDQTQDPGPVSGEGGPGPVGGEGSGQTDPGPVGGEQGPAHPPEIPRNPGPVGGEGSGRTDSDQTDPGPVGGER